MYKIYFALHALIYKLTACIFYIYTSLMIKSMKQEVCNQESNPILLFSAVVLDLEC